MTSASEDGGTRSSRAPRRSTTAQILTADPTPAAERLPVFFSASSSMDVFASILALRSAFTHSCACSAFGAT